MATMAMAGQEMERMHSRRPELGRAASVSERNRTLYEQQAARRRGPTPEMFFTKHIDNSRIVKEDDPERRREMRSFTIAMTLFFALTMVYVWQHFSAIEVGYKVEAQKTQVEQLRSSLDWMCRSLGRLCVRMERFRELRCWLKRRCRRS